MSKRKFAILINYGIEYRMFMLSGLCERLKQYGDVIFIKRDIDSKGFEYYTKLCDKPVVTIDKDIFAKPYSKIDKIFHGIRKARMRLLNIALFHNYSSVRTDKTFKDYILGNKFVYSIVREMTLFNIKRYYNNVKLQQKLIDLEITDILISGYASVGSIIFASNSQKINLSIYLFINSWKDFYINDFLPFKPTKMFVWSEIMKKNYLITNKHLNDSIVKSTGNPVFDRFYNYQHKQELEYYANKYNFDSKSNIFLYAMMDPMRYSGEEKIIELITNRFSQEMDDPFIILVKKNPFDTSINVDKYFADNKYVRVLNNYSEHNKDEDFFIQFPEGEQEWGDLLFYCRFTIGAASTVALESLMMKTPVVTIAFGQNGIKDELLIKLAEAPFYKDLINRKMVEVCDDINQCSHIFSKSNIKSQIPNILGYFDGKNLDRIMGEITNG
jgi:hypothetical protein